MSCAPISLASSVVAGVPADAGFGGVGLPGMSSAGRLSPEMPARHRLRRAGPSIVPSAWPSCVAGLIGAIATGLVALAARM